MAQLAKNLPAMRKLGFDPWVGKIPGRRERLPTPGFWPGEFRGQRSLAGYTPWGRKQSCKTDQLSLLLFKTSRNAVKPADVHFQIRTSCLSGDRWKCSGDCPRGGCSTGQAGRRKVQSARDSHTYSRRAPAPPLGWAGLGAAPFSQGREPEQRGVTGK